MHNLRVIQELGSQLQQCARTRSLLHGKRLHREIASNGYDTHVFVANSLLQMYGSCQCIQEARSIFQTMINRNIYSWAIFLNANAENGDLDQAKLTFERMPARNLASWNALIGACARNSQPRQALELFHRLIQEGEDPDPLTLVAVIDACGIMQSLQEGKLIHEIVLATGFTHNAVANTLITMYGKCQRPTDACSVFSTILHPDVVSWTSIVTAFSRAGYFDRSLEIFQEIPVEKNLVAWAAIITAAVRCDRQNAAFQLFQAMDLHGTRPSVIIYLSLLQGINSIPTIRALHRAAMEDEALPPDSNLAVMNAVLSAYGRHGELASSWAVFLALARKNPITWNSTAATFSQQGLLEQSMRILDLMPQWDRSSWNIKLTGIARTNGTLAAISFSCGMHLEGIDPDRASFIALIDSFSTDPRPTLLPAARTIASWIAQSELCTDPRLHDATIDMFGRCGDFATATAMLCSGNRSIGAASWGQMVANLARSGNSSAAISLFKRLDLEGAKPTMLAFVAAILACADSAELEDGEAIYLCFEQEIEQDEEQTQEHETEYGPNSSTSMVRNAAIHMYGRSGALGRADSLFRTLRCQSVVSWTSMIRALTSAGRVDQGFQLFREMLLQGIAPTAITMAELQSACAHHGLLREGVESIQSMLPDHGIAPTAENYACVDDLVRRSDECPESGFEPWIAWRWRTQESNLDAGRDDEIFHD